MTPNSPQKPPVNGVKNGSGGGGNAAGLYAYFTTRNGRRIYAKDYGHKCWPIGPRK